MNKNLAKKTAHKILLKNKLCSLDNFDELLQIIEGYHFTLIKYKKHNNSVYVSELFEKLGVKREMEYRDSFLYVSDSFKFLFLNEDISYEDKCSLLRHELGHICDPEFKSNDLNCSKVKKEEFASDFSCYVKSPGTFFKLYIFMARKWKVIVSTAVLTVCVLGLLFVFKPRTAQLVQPATSSENVYEISSNAYYTTQSGKRYHKRTCITVKNKTNLTKYTKEEAVKAGYTPCLICIHEE